MSDYEISAPYAIGSRDNARENSFLMDQRAERIAKDKEENSEINLAKSSIASLISSYNTADSGAMREHIVKSMKSYYNYLPFALQKEVEPYIANGPTSPMENKRREFLKLNPPPQEPELSTGDSKEVLPHFEQKLAEYQFQKADHRRALDSFLFGSDTAGEKKTFMPISETRVAIRSKEGQVMLLNNADLQAKEIATKYGVDLKDVYLRGEALPTGTKGFAILNGRKIDSEDTVNVSTGKKGTRNTGVSTVPKSSEELDMPPALTKFLLSWKSNAKDDSATEILKEKSMDDPAGVANELSQTFLGWSFKITPKKDKLYKRILDWAPVIGLAISVNNEALIIPIKGQPIELKDSTGKGYKYYYDPDNNVVRNHLNQSLGSLEQVSAELASKDLSKKGK